MPPPTVLDMAAPRIARYGIVGSGWRTQFFLRLARLLPQLFQVTGVVTRTAQRGAEVETEWGVATFRTVEELVTTSPDFVIVAVPWPETPVVTTALVKLGVKVLAETPPAPDAEGLFHLWGEVGDSGLVQVAEQYLSYPGHAARRTIVESGTIGTATSAHVSSTHMYHAVSLLRGMLGVGFDDVTVRASAFSAPVADPLSPAGWSGDTTPAGKDTTIATLDWGGRLGLYDFMDGQWWNMLRHRRILVRGTAGELMDDSVVRLIDARTPMTSLLLRREVGKDLNLEGLDLDFISFDGQVIWRNDYFGARLSDEDLATAELLRRTGDWAHGTGPAPYPLADGCHDHLLSLAMSESIDTDRPVTVGRQPWSDEVSVLTRA